MNHGVNSKALTSVYFSKKVDRDLPVDHKESAGRSGVIKIC